MSAVLLSSFPAVTAQTFSTLHHFNFTDGGQPEGELILSDGILYGTATVGGSSFGGAVYKIATNGSGFAILHLFTHGYNGATPHAGLILSGNTLYGTAEWGGSFDRGNVFAVNTDGDGFRTLHTFAATSGFSDSNAGGSRPYAGLILSGDTLYGAAKCGGSLGRGTIFKLNIDGTGFTTLRNFTPPISGMDSGGNSPSDSLILSGGKLYGTARFGGGPDAGTFFSLGTDGADFVNLRSFHGFGGGVPNGLILAGDIFYGTTQHYGTGRTGTVFSVRIDGTDFTTLHSFLPVPEYPPYSNTGGAHSRAGLILSGRTLYGTTSLGGGPGNGTIFRINTDGTGFQALHNFSQGSYNDAGYVINNDGAQPLAALLMAGGALYGTTKFGGCDGHGTVFRLSLPPASFAGWAAHFDLSGGAAAADSDPDADGLPNAAEFILGGNPAVAARSGRPAATSSGGNMEFTFSRDDASETPDVTLTVEAGTDLVTWPAVFTIGPDNAGSSSGVNITENGSGPDMITVTILQGTGTRLFARLKVTIAP